MQDQRKLLKELFASIGSQESQRGRITSQSTCKFFLMGLCPRDLFTGTRFPVGPCTKDHSETVKAEFTKLSRRERRKYGYEELLLQELRRVQRIRDQRLQNRVIRFGESPRRLLHGAYPLSGSSSFRYLASRHLVLAFVGLNFGERSLLCS